jgi:hypothetical protein
VKTFRHVVQCASCIATNAATWGHLMGIMNALRIGEYLKVAFIALMAGRR